MKVLFVGWGTWWHIYPIKSLIEYIKSSNTNISIYWVWEKNSIEQKIAKEENVNFIPIFAWKLRREKTIKAFVLNIFDLFKFFIWFFQAIYILLFKKIDVVFAKWWYVSLPVIFAAYFLRKKVFIHESDVIPGLTNKIWARFAKKVFWWFDYNKFLESIKSLNSSDLDEIIDLKDILKTSYLILWWEKKVLPVWQILSKDLVEWIDLNLEIDLDYKDKPNILVIWWSQWSKFLLEQILKLAKDEFLFSEKLNWFIVLWTKNKAYKDYFDKFKNVKVFDYLHQEEIGRLYYLADRSITRWWATSLAEQQLFGIKKIIVPLPYTAHNHQYWNGLYYKFIYWDILLKQENNLYKDLAKLLSIADKQVKNLKKEDLI